MIPRETVDKILDAVRIEEVIGEFVALKRRGSSYLACCPFHEEKTPSFSITPSKGFYYCFGCKEGGSAITFLMKHQNLSYTEALKYLAQKYHIEVEEKEATPEELQARQYNESLHLVTDYAQKFFVSNLKSQEGRAVGYQYFKSRGLTDETIEKYGLGWSPRDSHALLDAARSEGYKDEYLVESGVVVKVEDSGRMYDRFFDRVTFPVFSESGRVIGFSCRTLRSDKTVAKYVNSPETPIYVKRRSLFGIWFAKQQIAKSGKCILVEGNLDMIMFHQIGITNTVASCGTSLTAEQVSLIRRYTGENGTVCLIYDGDSAGIHAAIRGVDLILAGGLNIKVVILPDGDDPDSFSRKHTPEEVKQFIADNERDFVEFKTQVLVDDAAGDPLRTAELINDLADTIALIPDPIKRSTYAASIAARFNVERRLILDRVDGMRTKAQEQKQRQDEYRHPAEQSGQTRQPVPVAGEIPGATYKPLRKRKTVEDINAQAIDTSERDLLDFILNNGSDYLEFPPDSIYHTDPAVTVAEFIGYSLQEDGTVFRNPLYLQIYNAYFDAWSRGLSNEDCVKELLKSEDQRIVSIVVDLTVRKYEITERHLKGSLTKTSTILVREVPKTIIIYQVKLLDACIAECKAAMANKEGDIMALMEKMRDFNEKRMKMNNIIGRI